MPYPGWKTVEAYTDEQPFRFTTIYFLYCFLFVVIFYFLLFFVVLYMTAVLKIYDVLLPLRIMSYPPKNPPRPAFPFELELP